MHVLDGIITVIFLSIFIIIFTTAVRLGQKRQLLYAHSRKISYKRNTAVHTTEVMRFVHPATFTICKCRKNPEPDYGGKVGSVILIVGKNGKNRARQVPAKVTVDVVLVVRHAFAHALLENSSQVIDVGSAAPVFADRADVALVREGHKREDSRKSVPWEVFHSHSRPGGGVVVHGRRRGAKMHTVALFLMTLLATAAGKKIDARGDVGAVYMYEDFIGPPVERFYDPKEAPCRDAVDVYKCYDALAKLNPVTDCCIKAYNGCNIRTGHMETLMYCHKTYVWHCLEYGDAPDYMGMHSEDREKMKGKCSREYKPYVPEFGWAEAWKNFQSWW